MFIAMPSKLEFSEGWYASEITHLCWYNQGKTQKKAIAELIDSLNEHLDSIGVEPKAYWKWTNKATLEGKVCIPLCQPTIAFILRQVRAYKAVSLMEAAKAAGQSSKNSIAAYEKIGGREPSLTKFAEFLKSYDVTSVEICA